MAFFLLALALWPALALACPPVLVSVTVAPGSNHPTSVWKLPPNVTSQFMQTSESSEVSLDGYFRHVESFSTFPPDQTTFVDEFNFQAGTYYLHVAGHDKRCTGLNCPSIEFSDVMTFQITAGTTATSAATASSSYRAANAAVTCSDAGSGGGTLPDTSGGSGPDRVRPFETLTFAPVQDVDKLFVKARMSEAGTLTARGTVSVPGASKLYRFKKASRAVRANVSAKLRLKLQKKRLKAVKRALKRGKRLKAKITVTATDKAHNKRSQKATIRLKN
jgi:hypothetical protein